MTFRYYTASVKDVERIDALMGEQRENPLFVADDEDFIKRHISGEGVTLLAGTEGTGESVLSGFLILRFPKEAPDNLGRDLKLPEGRLEEVVHFESLVVSKAAQGQGLGGKLIAEGLKEAAKHGRRFALSTVHPDNLPSLKSFFKNGFEVRAEVIKYGGKPRRILYKEL